MDDPKLTGPDHDPLAAGDPRAGMTPKEAYDWEWQALPRWAKAISLFVGGPAFAVLVWSAFDDEAVGSQIKANCFALFAVVALLQVYCLTKVIRGAKRRER
ncbi:MAG: hypothetical protein K2X25_17940 [Caulobacteraceae bacterium]|nr:hypothetical protein [Caulobacteraceae bacterium]